MGSKNQGYFDEEEKCIWNVREWRTVELKFQKEDFDYVLNDELLEKYKNKTIETGVYLNYVKPEQCEKGIKEYDLSSVWDKKTGH